MRRHASDRVSDFFAARTRDVTPASAGHAARVLYVPISGDPAASALCATVLSAGERQRAARFAARRDGEAFRQRRAFRRYCAVAALGSSRTLEEIPFQETDRGRPWVRDAAGLRFSFSSCRTGLVGAWSPTHRIGVDLEDPARELEAAELAGRYFTAAEADRVASASGRARLRTFYRLWCLKEAALKSIGQGLPMGLDAFAFELDPPLRVARAPDRHGGPARFEAFLLEGASGCGALVLQAGS